MGTVEINKIRQAFTDIGVDDVDGVADDESLLEAGILDSLKLIDVVEELQARYKVRIRPTDLTPTNFDSLSAIKSLLDRLIIGSAKS